MITVTVLASGQPDISADDSEGYRHMTPCKCDCFECRIKRHDICRYMIKCIKRPWTQRRPS